jgi:hypothetical protein
MPSAGKHSQSFRWQIPCSSCSVTTPAGAAAVVLAQSDLFRDVLAGVPLAAASIRPLLITPQLSSTVGWLPKSSGSCPWTSRSPARRHGCAVSGRRRPGQGARLHHHSPAGGPWPLRHRARGRHPGGAIPGRTALGRSRRDRPELPDALAAGAAAGFGAAASSCPTTRYPQPVRNYVVPKQQATTLRHRGQAGDRPTRGGCGNLWCGTTPDRCLRGRYFVSEARVPSTLHTAQRNHCDVVKCTGIPTPTNACASCGVSVLAYVAVMCEPIR